MSFYLIKVGNKDRPAIDADIDDIRTAVKKSIKNLEQLVTHHGISVHLVNPPAGHAVMWKVGTDDFPATPDDIKAMEAELNLAVSEKRPVVTHHAIDFTYFC